MKNTPEALPVSDPDKYKVGTLHYTKASLFVLFSWLIWGNLCFSLFESAGGPNILGLYLQDNYHVTNLQVNILFNVIPMLIGMVMTPVISFKSDRTRSRFGRRIPFILFTIPFLVAFSIALGFTDEIIAFSKVHFSGLSFISPFSMALLIVGFMTVGFSFFNEFVGTVYYYLCPDVVPSKFIGRFQGVSQVAGTAVGFLINLYIVPHQLTHLKAIHVGVAVLYFIGFGLLCWRVKEGEYPPVTDVTGKTPLKEQVRLYFRECFTHPVFVLLYISTAAIALTRGLNPAGVFALHVSQHQSQIPMGAGSAACMAVTSGVGRVVTAGSDGTVTIWDVSRMRAPVFVKSLAPAGAGIRVMAVATNGQTVLAGVAGGRFVAWNTASGERRLDVVAHEGEVNAVAISPDGARAATAGSDRKIKIWDLVTGSCLQVLAGHEEGVNAVAFSSSGEQLVSGGDDRAIMIWDTRRGVLLKKMEGSPGPLYAVCFAPAITAVAQEEASPKTFLARVREAPHHLYRNAFANESLYNAPSSRRGKVLGDDLWVLAGGRDGVKDDENSAVRVWDVSSGEVKQVMKGHKQAVTCLVYKPDLQVVLSGSRDGSIRLWEPVHISAAATDQSFKTFSGYTRAVTSIDCQRDGVLVVNASADGTTHLWNIDAGISLAKNGILMAFLSILGLLLAYPLGSLVDRMNPLKLTLWAALMTLPVPLLRFFLLNDYMSSFWITVLSMPFSTLILMASMPMLIMIFPKSKFGQMSSANAMVRQFVAAMAGPLGAIFMDYMTDRSMKTDNFRYGYLFQCAAHLLSLLALLGVYFQWKKLGGAGYVAPEADEAGRNGGESATPSSVP